MALLLGIMGVLCFILLYFPVRFFRQTRGCTMEAMGKVVGLEEFRGYRSGSWFRMRVTYQWEGKQYSGMTRARFRYDDCAARDSITVWVDPQQPERFKAAGEERRARLELATSIVLLAVVALFFASAVT